MGLEVQGSCNLEHNHFDEFKGDNMHIALFFMCRISIRCTGSEFIITRALLWLPAMLSVCLCSG